VQSISPWVLYAIEARACCVWGRPGGRAGGTGLVASARLLTERRTFQFQPLARCLGAGGPSTKHEGIKTRTGTGRSWSLGSPRWCRCAVCNLVAVVLRAKCCSSCCPSAHHEQQARDLAAKVLPPPCFGFIFAGRAVRREGVAGATALQQVRCGARASACSTRGGLEGSSGGQ
jgi:hypothetical protein